MNAVSPPLRSLGILLEYPTLNGGEQSLLAVLGCLSPQKFRPVLLAPQSGPLAEACRQQQIVHHPLDLSELWRDHERLKQALLAATEVHGFHVVHANSLSAGRKLGAVASHLPCPTTSHLRDIVKLSGPAIKALNAHSRLIAVSEATRQFHLAQGMQSETVVTIHNGIALDKFRPQPRTGSLHAELRLPAHCLLAGTVGQICLRKAQNDLAAAATLLRDRLPQLHFVLIGQRHSMKAESVEFDEQITRTFADAGMAHRLHRIGWRSEMQSLYPELSLLIHPARQEPLGRVLLEAAACGLPIVATRIGGTPEILTHDESGWLVPPGDPLSLAAGIEKLCTSEEIRERFVNSSRSRIVERFSIEQATRFHEEFWTDVIDTSEEPRHRQ